ncbi:MAG: hypothetical protein Q8Q52_07060, partial [Acidimicrobiia bacterium]|nr:hypothetical protein [Acidimicrobiia bacterium]
RLPATTPVRGGFTGMRMTRLGSLEVSVVGLGCNNFGRALPEQLAANASGAEWEPTPEDLRELDQLTLTLDPGAGV